MSFKSSLGNILKAAAPVAATFIPGIGPIAGPLVGAAMGAIGGGGVKGAIAGGLGGLAAGALKKNADSANADSKRAHELADQSAAMAQQASATANQQYGLNAPLRNAFRFGALNFGDSSNPFDRSNQFAQFRAGLTPESTAPAGAAPAGGLGKALMAAASTAKAKAQNTAMLQAAPAGNE